MRALRGTRTMSKVIFVDTSKTARGGRRRKKPHACYDGEKTFEVYELTKLGNYNEIFIDSLFAEFYDEVLELLKRGVKVYYLKDTSILKKLRRQKGLKKSDIIDVILLANIPRDYFKQLTVEEMERRTKLDPLINKYELLTRRIAFLRQWIKNDGWDYGLSEVIKLMGKDKEDVARKIVEAISNNAIYREACKMLGVRDSVELAILVTKLPLHLPLVKLKGLLGFTPNKNKGRHYHELRWHVTALATCLYMNARKRVSVSEEIAEIVNYLPREKAIYRLGLMILKALRKAYFIAAEPLAGGSKSHKGR